MTLGIVSKCWKHCLAESPKQWKIALLGSPLYKDHVCLDRDLEGTTYICDCR